MIGVLLGTTKIYLYDAFRSLIKIPRKAFSKNVLFKETFCMIIRLSA